MKCIAAVDSNWAIGFKGRLLVSIPSDQKMFRAETSGKVIVLGHKTLETFPNGIPLSGRENVILTRDKNLKIRGARVVHSEKELWGVLSLYNSDDIYFVGGQSIYEQFAPYCDTAIITYMDQVYEADSHFPNLDKDDDWELVAESEEQTYFSVEYTFREYRNRNVKNIEDYA